MSTGTTSAGEDVRDAPNAPASRTRPVAVDPSTYLRRPRPLVRIRDALRTVTTAGWFTLVLVVTCWLLGWLLGWDEFALVAAVGLVCLLVALMTVIGRTSVEVEVEVNPQRVVVGERAAAQLVVRNETGRRLLPFRMELTVGRSVAEFDVGSLSPGADHDEVFVLPTSRRAVIPVGPAAVVRGDELGLLRRSARHTEPVPLIVHPRTVRVGHLGSGLMRDLEGQVTPDLSPADVAFHALREYEPGDDRRFIHWLTSARVGRLVVRQFNDTRRAHLALILDELTRSYPDDENFEVAVSVAASLGVRALTDEQELTVSVGSQRIPSYSGQGLLDALAAVEPSRRGSGLVEQARELGRSLTAVSLVAIVTGASTSPADLRAAAMRFGEHTRALAIRVDPSNPTGFRQIGSTQIVDLNRLDDLPRVLLAVTPA